MISEYNFETLCHKYNLTKDKILNNNSSVLKQGKFQEIDETLNYLINCLNISVRNIEKCPSILYRNVKQIKENVNFLNSKNLSILNIESCLHILSTESDELKKTYDYVFKNYGFQAIEKITSILSVPVDIINDVESLNICFVDPIGNLAVATGVEFGITNINEVSKILQSKEYQEHPELFTSEVLARAKLEDIKKIIHSKEYQEHPELFTSTTLAHATLEDIQKILQSKEYQEHPELFTSTTLAHATLEDIQKIIQSKEYQEHPELFTSEVLAKAKLEDIKKIIQSKEYQEHPELFTSQVLARAKLEDIKKIIQSKEYQEHPELFTSTTLAHATLEDIQKILQSKEYQEHPELFTSEVLANAKLEDIQKILQSKEYQEHPELFTSQVLARARLEDIQKIIQSKEYQEHPEMFTSTTLARAKLEDIQKLLQLPYWVDEKYERLLTSSVIANSKSMIKKLPNLIKLAEYYEIAEFINYNYLKNSPSQNFALINYLLENNIPLIVNNKLNPLFLRTSGVLKKKYSIDLKVEMLKYDFSKFKSDEEIKSGGGKGGIR